MVVDDFSMCALNGARRAARALSRRYDRKVRHLGLKAAQFSVLILVRETSGLSTGELADAFSMERTTLVRNIALLEQKGLVRSVRPDKSRRKVYELTDAGSDLLETAIPIWREAQAELEAELGSETFLRSINVLKRLATV